MLIHQTCHCYYQVSGFNFVTIGYTSLNYLKRLSKTTPTRPTSGTDAYGFDVLYITMNFICAYAD